MSTNASGFGDLTDASLVVPESTTGLLDALRPGDVLLLDGHPGLALRVARRARGRGCVVVLDGGSWKPDAPAMIGLCDAVVVSADFRPPGVAADDVLDAVAALGPRLVARTRGPLPVEVLDAGRGTRSRSRSRVASSTPWVRATWSTARSPRRWRAGRRGASRWRTPCGSRPARSSTPGRGAGSPRLPDTGGRGTKVPRRDLLGYISVTKPRELTAT